MDFARNMGFPIVDLTEIDVILKDIKRQYEEQKPIIHNQIKSEIYDLHTKIETAENTIELQKPQILKEIELESENLKNEIEALHSIEFSIKHLFHYFSSKLKLRRYNKRLDYLEIDTQIEINKRLEKKISSLRSLERRLNNLENNTDEEVKSRLSHLVSQLNKLEDIKNSNEYKGALGELAVIKNLSELSDDYYLFNDLYLELNEYIKFNGSSLKSAQIDHLVVGPTGVFVIETKNWSKRYTQSVFNDGSYTPYEQIQRSSYLVYRYLNDYKYGNTFQKIYYNLAKDEVRVKSIIAIAGSTIPFEKHRFVRVLRHNAIPAHIKKGKRVFTTTSVNEIASKWCFEY